MAHKNATFERLERQIAWFDAQSRRHKRLFQGFKAAEITAAAAIPLVTVLKWPGPIAAALGAIVVFIEAVLQLNQHFQHWIVYRSTCEALLREKYLYLGQAGRYRKAEERQAALAEQIETLLAAAQAKWISAQEHAERVSAGAFRE
jgi:hypothetical protein